jgi:signal transduction histidine kinase
VAAFHHSRQWADLTLWCAVAALLLADLAFGAAPAVTGRVGVESGGGARLASDLVVALAFALAAFAPARTVARARTRVRTIARGWTMVQARRIAPAPLGPVLLAILAAAVTMTVAELLAPVSAAAPAALAVHATSAVVLLVSALAFLRRPGRGQTEGRLLAGAAFLFSGAMLHYLPVPEVATNWVTPREGLRLAGYALLLGAANHRYGKLRRQQAYQAISSERERIARDLHDGLAQDLACIVSQAQRLDVGVGPEHPLMIATRRALAASRGTIADLAASTAPTTEAALRVIADELEHRFDLMVDVQVETDVALTGGNDLEPAQREDLIRVAREAIVNAALHGKARRVELVLVYRRGDLLMRVSDDGRGLTETHTSGFGGRTMRARAASLGGEINARARAGGGTELELVVS